MRKKKEFLQSKRDIFWAHLGAKSYKKGRYSETLATWYLRCKGYKIIARRWRLPCGEIDIIARKGKLIAIVEIKARDSLKQAMEAVSPLQQKRIEAAADFWLARQKDFNKLSLRFDLIAICPKRLPQHIKACWTAEYM